MKRILIAQTVAVLTAGSCLAHTWMAQWTPRGWTSCLGPHLNHGHVPDATPVAGQAFLLEADAREEPADHLKVLRAQLIGEALGEPKDERAMLRPAGLWHSAAMEMKRGISAEVAASRGEPREIAAKAVEIKAEDRNARVDEEGSIIVPAVSCSTREEDEGKILVMESADGGLQLHLARLGKGTETPAFECSVDVPKAGRYALTADVVTVHTGVSVDVSVNGYEQPVRLAMPYTVGEWASSEPVELNLLQGQNKLVFRGVSNSYGVSIKRFCLAAATSKWSALREDEGRGIGVAVVGSETPVVRAADRAVAGHAGPSAITMTDVEVLKHLYAYQQHTICSYLPSGLEWGRTDLVKARPVEQLIAVYQRRDPVMQKLGGVFFGLLCKDIGDERFFTALKADLTHADAGVRRFACEALGYLGEKKAIPLLKGRLEDHAVVPGWSDGRVSLAAAFAIERLGGIADAPVEGGKQKVPADTIGP